MKSAIIGTGLIGRSFAIVFAKGGHEVSLWDGVAGQAETALAAIAASLADMADCGLVESPDPILKRIGIAPDLAGALGGAAHVQESIAEKLEPKRQIFAAIETHAPPDAVLASSTSAILPSAIFEALASRHRCLVAHPMNPPHLAPVIELCGAPFTDPAILAATAAVFAGCGMAPVTVKREVPGFILNRLQLALLGEAFRLIANGYVTAADLDTTVKDGLALRWSFMGPIETSDLNAPGGIADYLARYGEAIREAGRPVAGEPDWPADMGNMLAEERQREVPRDRLAEAQAWRDRRLMALALHKAEAEARFPRATR
jgi:3-hydroxyacyl-CoA dehydrogenase